MHNFAWQYKIINLWVRLYHFSQKTHIFRIWKDGVYSWHCYPKLRKALSSKAQADEVDNMEKKISPSKLDENRSKTIRISEEDLIQWVENEAADLYLDNVEPYFFFKGAVLCMIFCLPFWIILFMLISLFFMRIH